MTLELLACAICVMASPFMAREPIYIGGYGETVDYPTTITVNQDMVAGDADYLSIDLSDGSDVSFYKLPATGNVSIFVYSVDLYYANNTYYLTDLTFCMAMHSPNFATDRGMPVYDWVTADHALRCYGQVWSWPMEQTDYWHYVNTAFNPGQEGAGYNYVGFNSGIESEPYLEFSTAKFSNWAYSYFGSMLYVYRYAYLAGYDDGYNEGYNVAAYDNDSVAAQYMYTQGYNAGYQDGVDANESGVIMSNLFGAVVAVPIQVLNGLTPLAIWQVPIISIIITLLIVALLLWIIKRFI